MASGGTRRSRQTRRRLIARLAAERGAVSSGQLARPAGSRTRLARRWRWRTASSSEYPGPKTRYVLPDGSGRGPGMTISWRLEPSALFPTAFQRGPARVGSSPPATASQPGENVGRLGSGPEPQLSGRQAEPLRGGLQVGSGNGQAEIGHRSAEKTVNRCPGGLAAGNRAARRGRDGARLGRLRRLPAGAAASHGRAPSQSTRARLNGSRAAASACSICTLRPRTRLRERAARARHSRILRVLDPAAPRRRSASCSSIALTSTGYRSLKEQRGIGEVTPCSPDSWAHCIEPSSTPPSAERPDPLSPRPGRRFRRTSQVRRSRKRSTAAGPRALTSRRGRAPVVRGDGGGPDPSGAGAACC
jgi:hypothetical protein